MDASEVISKIKTDEKFRSEFVKDPVATIKKSYPLTPAQEAELKKIDFKKLMESPKTKTLHGTCGYMEA